MKLVIALALCPLILTGLVSAGGNFRFSSTVMEVMEGESVTMECRYSRKTDDRYLIWGYVSPGTQVIKRILHWKPLSQVPTYASPDTHRYVAVKNFARKLMTLKITNATQQDSTRYFCQLTDHEVQENRTDFCGCGTTLKVQPVPPSSPPSVYLQYPSQEEISNQGSVRLLCLLTGFYPPRVRVAWYVGGVEVTSGISQRTLTRDPQHRYSTVSWLEVSGQDWARAGLYQCVVSHSALSQPIVKEIRTRGFVTPSPCLDPPPLPPSTSETPTNQTATFTCIASMLRVDGVSIRWLRDGSELPESSGPPLSVTHPHGTHSISSQLTVRQEEWSPGSSYVCIVTQETLSTPPSYTGTARHVEVKMPEVLLLQIKGHESSADEAKTNLACFVSAFYPANISVTWRSPDGDPIDGWASFPATADTEGTFNVVSVISVPTEAWETGQSFTCVVVHQSSEEPIERQLAKDDGSFQLYGYPLWFWKIIAICILIVYTVIIVILTHCCNKCIQGCCGRRHSHSLWTGSEILMDSIKSADPKEKASDREREIERLRPNPTPAPAPAHYFEQP